MKRLLTGVATACALALAGCGGGHPSPHHATKPPAPVAPAVASAACPAGHSYMGCAVTAQTALANARLRRAGVVPPLTVPAPTGGLFPDVYEGQGTVDWNAVKAWQQSHGWRVAGIFKMGEFRIDFQAARNAQQTLALGFWRAGYWFVRNTGCQSEADQIIQAAHEFHVIVVEEDLEVPEAAGYGACLTPLLRRAGLIPGEYTSPGSNPGGVDTSAPLWEATFGSSFSPIWHPVVAWQCSDGVFGCVTFVPGVGHDDVNVDLGITNLGAPPPDPFAVFVKTVFRFGRDHASEYRTAKLWAVAKCRNPVRREVCKSTHYHLELLLGRDNFVAFHELRRGRWVELRHPRWSYPSKSQPLGSRAALIRADLRQR